MPRDLQIIEPLVGAVSCTYLMSVAFIIDDTNKD